MNKGTIIKITDKGFGFIKPDGEDKDLFFHAREVNDMMFNSLKEGQRVTFETAEGPKGPNAANVTVVSDDAAASDDVADESDMDMAA